MIWEALREQITDSNEALCSLLQHFAKTRDVGIEVNGKELGDWLKTANIEHRCQVKIVRR